MNLVRNDRQTALHDLLIAIEESADHYQDAADFLNEHPACVYLEQFAKQRLILTTRLEEAIRAEGELPAAPDPDRETSAKLFEHLLASLTHNEASRVLEQRMKKEEEISELAQAAVEAGVGEDHPELLNDIVENNRLVLQSLRDLLEHTQ